MSDSIKTFFRLNGLLIWYWKSIVDRLRFFVSKSNGKVILYKYLSSIYFSIICIFVYMQFEPFVVFFLNQAFTLHANRFHICIGALAQCTSEHALSFGCMPIRGLEVMHVSWALCIPSSVGNSICSFVKGLLTCTCVSAFVNSN